MNNFLLNTKCTLSLSTTNCIKGLLAVMVLICHLHARVDLFSTSIFGTLFSAFGYLAVSCFFFLSGYGLHEVSQKKERYILDFPKKKLLPFFCLSCFVILIYLLRDLLTGSDVKILEVLQSFFIADTIVDNGWYMQVQMLFYMLFYISYRFGKKKRNLLLIILVSLYCLLGFAFNMATTWYETSLCFPLGILYSKVKDKINNNLISYTKKWLLALALLSCAFIVTLFFGNKPILFEPLRIFVKMISAMIFSTLIALLFSKININFFFTRFLGKYSLEIYLTQGIFMSLFIEQIPINNDWLYILIVASTTIIFSILVHPIFKFVSSIGKKEITT